MNLQYIPLLFLFSIVFLYKLLFWLYVIQLKEYRFDRFKEYFNTSQGKAAFFNFWFILEIILGFFALFLLFDENLEILYYPVVFSFLIFQSIFVFGKVFRKKILFPKKTARLLITSLLVILIFFLLLFIQFSTIFPAILYGIIFLTLTSIPGIIFISIYILKPLVGYKKNKKIHTAISKSKKINGPIKVAITGSFGKSSVKTYLSQILESKYKILYTPENINTELGVSEIIIKKLKNGFNYFIAEIGAYKIGEISLLGEIVNHKYGFLTGIGNQHLALFGSQENIKKGKFEIIEKVIENKGKLYVNYDNTHIQDYLLISKTNLECIVKYSLSSQDADVKGQIVGLKDAITSFNIFVNGSKFEFKTKLIGDHNILNLTGIIGFCFDQGMTYEEIRNGLAHVAAPKNTLEIHNKNNAVLIDDTYNLSEDGLFAGLDAASSFGKEKQIYLVVDDILELGLDSEKKHKVFGKIIAENYNIKSIFYVGKNYNKAFKVGLIESGYENLLAPKFQFHISEEFIYLFEGRNARKYFEIIMNK